MHGHDDARDAVEGDVGDTLARHAAGDAREDDAVGERIPLPRLRQANRGPSGHRGPQVPHAHRGARMLLAPARLGVGWSQARADLDLSDGDAAEIKPRVLEREVPAKRPTRRGVRKGVGCGWLEPHRRVGVRPQDGEGARKDLRLHPPPP